MWVQLLCACVLYSMGSRGLKQWLWRHISHMGEMRDSDWLRPKMLRSDWLGLMGSIITTESVGRIGSHLTNFRGKSPAWIVDTFDTSEGQPYPILSCAITLTWYLLFGLRWVNRHDWVDWETFFVVHCPSELAGFICARYPVTIPPSASRDGGFQVKFIELQPLSKSKSMTEYVTSFKSESSFSINQQK